MSIREVAQGTQTQGEDEGIVYTITTTNWASAPTETSMIVKDRNGTNVTATVAPTGSTSVTGDVITLPAISGLAAGQRYRVDVQFTTGGGEPFECYFFIECEE
uniref:Uncharacterized protein n=1 Tax=viral metagenome TaxID=1070528 RepID=A0A6M3J4N7_9ZZZZ